MNKIGVIWVIDDDEIYRFAIRLILKRANITELSEFFNNGKVALDRLSGQVAQGGQLPDLILLDLNMPVLDGWQFLDAYKKLKLDLVKPITIYLVSSSIDEEDKNNAKSNDDVSGLIVKPISIKAIQNILSEFQANSSTGV